MLLARVLDKVVVGEVLGIIADGGEHPGQDLGAVHDVVDVLQRLIEVRNKQDQVVVGVQHVLGLLGVETELFGALHEVNLVLRAGLYLDHLELAEKAHIPAAEQTRLLLLQHAVFEVFGTHLILHSNLVNGESEVFVLAADSHALEQNDLLPFSELIEFRLRGIRVLFVEVVLFGARLHEQHADELALHLICVDCAPVGADVHLLVFVLNIQVHGRLMNGLRD